jgi:hypothetical protein
MNNDTTTLVWHINLLLLYYIYAHQIKMIDSKQKIERNLQFEQVNNERMIVIYLALSTGFN